MTAQDGAPRKPVTRGNAAPVSAVPQRPPIPGTPYIYGPNNIDVSISKTAQTAQHPYTRRSEPISGRHKGGHRPGTVGTPLIEYVLWLYYAVVLFVVWGLPVLAYYMGWFDIIPASFDSPPAP